MKPKVSKKSGTTVKNKTPKKSESEHSFAQRYKLILSKKQTERLVQWGGAIRLISNAAKEEREIRFQQNKNRPEKLRGYINSFSQLYHLPEIKSLPGYEFLNDIPSQVLQQSLMDLNKSFQSFLSGEKGYPRWKSRTKDGTQLRFPDGKNIKVRKLNRNKSEVVLSKIGNLRFKTGNNKKVSRSIPKNARIRSVTINGNSSGTEFFVSFNLGIDEKEFEESIPVNDGPAVGGDRGIVTAMQLSNGENWIFPRKSVNKLKNKIKKGQRKLAKQNKPNRKNPNHKASNYKKQQLKIAKLHGKIKNIRLDFNHKLTTQIAQNHSLVVLENLRLKNMSKSAKGTIEKPGRSVSAKSGLNRELLNIGMGMMEEMLEYKTKWYGSHLILVNPKNSSRECCKCGHTSKENRKNQSVFECTKCGHAENADLNAAKIILARGHRVLACGETVSLPKTSVVGDKKVSKTLKRKEPRTSEKRNRKVA